MNAKRSCLHKRMMKKERYLLKSYDNLEAVSFIHLFKFNDKLKYIHNGFSMI